MVVDDDGHEGSRQVLMEADFNVSELRSLQRDLGKASGRIVPEAIAVMKKSGQNIKTDWAQAWSGHAHIPALPKAITYDVNITFKGINVEVGPDKAKPQGALGNIAEFGTVNNPPIPGGAPALAKEEPRLEAQLFILMGGLLDGR